MTLYRRVGKAVCTENEDWPPLLRDNVASEKTIQMVVDALNYCIKAGVLVEKEKK